MRLNNPLGGQVDQSLGDFAARPGQCTLQGHPEGVENFRLGIRQPEPRHLLGDRAHLTGLAGLSGLGIVLQHLAGIYGRSSRGRSRGTRFTPIASRIATTTGITVATRVVTTVITAVVATVITATVATVISTVAAFTGGLGHGVAHRAQGNITRGRDGRRVGRGYILGRDRADGTRAHCSCSGNV